MDEIFITTCGKVNVTMGRSVIWIFFSRKKGERLTGQTAPRFLPLQKEPIFGS